MSKGNSIRLTATSVTALVAREREYWVYDSDLPGFAVRILNSGRKTFVAQYRPGGGGNTPKRTVTIGRFGTITVEQARQKAKTILADAILGKDPAKEIKTRRQEMTIRSLIDLYEQRGCIIQRGQRQGDPMKERTKKLTLARLRNHVVPLLGNRRLSDVGASDIEKLVLDITNGKTARDEVAGPRTRIIVRGGAGGARKVFRDISAVFSFAVRNDIMYRNPCETAAVRKGDNHRDRYLTPEELTRFGKALDELQAEGLNPKVLNIARLLALTGCRLQEIVSLKWAEVNFAQGLLELADSKTGKSIRPLGAVALNILRSIAKTEGTDFVFPASIGESSYQGLKRHWPKIMKRAELTDVTPHTLRHTMGSTATSTGEALALTGAILGHANMQSTAIYAHVQREPSKRAANRVSKKIAALMAGGKSPPKKTAQKPAQKNMISDEELMRLLRERLGDKGEKIEGLYSAVAQSLQSDSNDIAAEKIDSLSAST
jgi:integrase